MPRHFILVIMILTTLFLAACDSQPSSSCPQGTATPQYLTLPPDELPVPTPNAAPVDIEIRGKSIRVDKVVAGPLCNDNWSGTVYVSCNIQIYPWKDYPTFLKDCNLTIAPDTIVYVAHHNDAAYYNGCSCHTSELATP